VKKPTETLIEEHRVIESVLSAIEQAVRRQDTGRPLPAQFFLDVADFIRDFADGHHHRKEESVLFKALLRVGFSEQQGPVAVMLHEHEQGRAFTRAMTEAAQRVQQGDESARTPLADAALSYASLLRQHIMKENHALFRMADQALPPAEQDRIAAEFLRIEGEESGARHKYLALAEALVAQVSA
jgi:hemerythrin-like domain-containing protein